MSAGKCKSLPCGMTRSCCYGSLFGINVEAQNARNGDAERIKRRPWLGMVQRIHDTTYRGAPPVVVTTIDGVR